MTRDAVADPAEPTLGAGQPAILRDLLGTAIRAAREGGAQVTARSGQVSGVGHKSSDTDPVTDTDRASERAIVALITADRPDDGMLGEEGADRIGTTGFRWVIDPLDGTVNYLYGIPHTAVSVACEQAEGGGWVPVVGAVYDPARDELFTAARGSGARLNGGPISVRSPLRLAESLVTTGFSYSATRRARQAGILADLLPRVRDIRSGGSAALELCWVAAGRSDGYYEDELAPWDTAAGALIVIEAGGVVTGLGDGGVLAAPPLVHENLRPLVDPRPNSV